MTEKGKGQQLKAAAKAGALVPVYTGVEPVRGIQAFRRGEMILYTIRGEPERVQELLGELERKKVGEVIALISHKVDALEPPHEIETDQKDQEQE